MTGSSPSVNRITYVLSSRNISPLFAFIKVSCAVRDPSCVIAINFYMRLSEGRLCGATSFACIREPFILRPDKNNGKDPIAGAGTARLSPADNVDPIVRVRPSRCRCLELNK